MEDIEINKIVRRLWEIAKENREPYHKGMIHINDVMSVLKENRNI